MRRDVSKWTGILVAATLLIGAGSAMAQEGKAVAPRPSALGPMKYRVGDMDKSVEFYKRVLGMQEVFRVRNAYPPNDPNMLIEVGLKFGNTVDEAKADKGNTLVLMNREKAAQPYKAPDDLPNFIITVADVDAVAKRTRDSGYTV
jgi:catechol 2,3-dioxygenase-like lactoylglutathione lyase family enzyme